MKITKVYTKTGDEGTTSLVGGVKVKKTNSRIEAYGTVDELSANLGLLASFMKDGPDKNLIYKIQRNLFTVCSYLATDKTKTQLAPSYTLDAHLARRLACGGLRPRVPHGVPPRRAQDILPGRDDGA